MGKSAHQHEPIMQSTSAAYLSMSTAHSIMQGLHIDISTSCSLKGQAHGCDKDICQCYMLVHEAHRLAKVDVELSHDHSKDVAG